MNRTIESKYGVQLLQAAEAAIQKFAYETSVMKEIDVSADFEFEFHGIHLPLTAETTAAALVNDVKHIMRERAKLYDEAVVAPDPSERRQYCRRDETLDEGYLKAVQCGMLWGNLYLKLDGPETYGRLRHVFEFADVKIPFNPWREGEPERVLAATLAALATSTKAS